MKENIGLPGSYWEHRWVSLPAVINSTVGKCENNSLGVKKKKTLHNVWDHELFCATCLIHTIKRFVFLL